MEPKQRAENGVYKTRTVPVFFSLSLSVIKTTTTTCLFIHIPSSSSSSAHALFSKWSVFFLLRLNATFVVLFPSLFDFFFLMASCFCLPPPEKETKLANRYNSAIMAPHSVRRSERTNHARLYFVSCLFRGYFYGQHFLLVAVVVVAEMPWAWWIATERRSNSHRDGEIYRPCRWCTGPRSLFSLRALLLLLNIFIAVENGVNDVGEEEEEPQKARRRILDTQEEERSP